MTMRHINFDLSLEFDTPQDRWRSEQLLLWKMTILTLRNFWFLLDNPDFPKLYDSGMVYLLPEQLERRPSRKQLRDLEDFLKSRMGMTPDEVQHHLDLARGVEIFRDIPRMMEHGGGDCDNWAAARSAEIAVAAYRLGGKSGTRPYLVWHDETGRMIYHAKIMHGDGSDEDPSIIMGMGGSDRAPDRLEECRKNYERYDNMWQRAKSLLSNEDFKSEDERYARAAELKASIDSFGFLPKDGVFHVGQPKAQMVLGYLDRSRAKPARSLDLLGASYPNRDWGDHYIDKCSCGATIGQCKCPSRNKTVRVTQNGCERCRAQLALVGHGGHHGHGGHYGGGMRQSWGFGGAPTTFIVEDEAPELYLTDYEYGVVSAAREPTATVTPSRRLA